MRDAKEIFSLFRIKNSSETKDFTLMQGGRRRKGGSILKYVTDFASAANAAGAKKIRFGHKEFAWRL
ncbi:hypothetical protein ABEH87_21705 [Erwinia sp. Eh17-17]|uniref:hypothetical protein n=1 Tax=Erwinia sp. Eh17-17 TaxID=3080330 RepID=UPI003207F44F